MSGDFAADIDSDVINDFKNDFSKRKGVEMNVEDET